MKKRNRNAKTEREGLLAVEEACNRFDLIWRDLLQEDVGIDGTIEVAIGEFPTGKLVGAQVKSGTSYIKGETSTSFRFYPDSDDIQYWSGVSIPMFLLVHDPRSRTVYWADITRYVQERAEDPLGPSYINFTKSDVLDERFSKYLRERFDLVLYSNEQYATAYTEFQGLSHTFGADESAVTITALDLFIEGLWGLCSKVQFHSSLMSELIRRSAARWPAVLLLTYTFDRASLYPFLTRYFNLLSRHHMATLDSSDINQSLYVKLEFPAFIAPLTTNGRRFTEYLRATGIPRVHDNQHLTLALLPHVQIEVYSSFRVDNGHPVFGAFTDVLGISFNSLLDYYRIEHWRRAPGETAKKVWEQNAFFSEVSGYLIHHFDAVPKDCLLFRYRDAPLAPLICWLEEWNDNRQPIAGSDLKGKSNAETAGFHDELMAIMAPAGTMTVTEPNLPQFPSQLLASGELLY